MAARAVAGVEHRDVRHELLDVIRHPRRGMAHHQPVDSHLAERPDRVAQAFALGHARARSAPVDDFGAGHPFGDVERVAGARGILEEKVRHGEAAKRIERPLRRARQARLQRQRALHEILEILRRPVVQIEQVLAVPRHKTPPSGIAFLSFNPAARFYRHGLYSAKRFYATDCIN